MGFQTVFVIVLGNKFEAVVYGALISRYLLSMYWIGVR